jgi:phage/plasmid-like protein (TIGR03299 family)
MTENNPTPLNLLSFLTPMNEHDNEPPAHDPIPEPTPAPASGFALDHKGIDWEQHSPDQGIYLWMRDATTAEVARGGSVRSPASLRMLKGKKIRGWDTGKVIPGNVKTTAEAMQVAGLDWTVTQRPVYAHMLAMDDKGNLPESAEDTGTDHIRASRFVANVRDDNEEVLGVVGKNWRGPQNWEAFTFMDDLVDDGSAKWLGAGEIDGGRRIYGLTQFSREILVGGDEDERCIPLGFLSNGWDGGLSVTITVAPFRLACTNGMTIPLEGCLRQWKVQHRRNVKMNLDDARKTLQLTVGYMDLWEDMANSMISTRMGEGDFGRFVDTLVPLPKPGAAGEDDRGYKRSLTLATETRELISHTYKHDEDLANIRGTVWGAYNAVADYADWQAPQRGERKAEKALLRSVEDSTLKNKAYAVLKDTYALAGV